MKNLVTTVLLILSGCSLFAQEVVEMKNETFAFSSGDKQVFVVTFNGVAQDHLNVAVKEYLKNYKAKATPVKGVDGEWNVEEFVITDIDQKATTITMKMAELEGNATWYVNYNVEGADITEESSPNLFPQFKDFTTNIANKAIYLAYEDRIEAEKALLKSKEKELKDLEKSEKKQTDNIASANQSIKTSEGDISNFEGALKRQQGVVADKQKQVSDKENEIASVEVKTLEKSIKDIESDNGKTQKEIEKLNGEIAKIKGEIAMEETALEELDKTIEAKKEVLAITANKKDLKEVKTLESDRAKQIGDTEKLRTEIGSVEAEIDANKAKIEQGNGRVVEIREQIASHNEEALKDQLKLLVKDAKEAEAEQKKIEKDIEKEQSSIAKQQERIREANIEIARLTEEQSAKKTEISATEAAIKELLDMQKKSKN